MTESTYQWAVQYPKFRDRPEPVGYFVHKDEAEAREDFEALSKNYRRGVGYPVKLVRREIRPWEVLEETS